MTWTDDARTVIFKLSLTVLLYVFVIAALVYGCLATNVPWFQFVKREF